MWAEKFPFKALSCWAGLWLKILCPDYFLLELKAPSFLIICFSFSINDWFDRLAFCLLSLCSLCFMQFHSLFLYFWGFKINYVVVFSTPRWYLLAKAICSGCGYLQKVIDFSHLSLYCTECITFFWGFYLLLEKFAVIGLANKTV